MANSRPDILVSTGAWLNLYTASGIALGTTVTITNKGSSPCYVAIALSAPAITATPMGLPLFAGAESNMCNVPSGASGLWAFAPNSTATLLVQD